MTAPSTGRDGCILRRKKPDVKWEGTRFRECGRRSFFPLPLRERVAKLRAKASNEPGEGFASQDSNEDDPSPGASLCSAPPSPTRGEGKPSCRKNDAKTPG